MPFRLVLTVDLPDGGKDHHLQHTIAYQMLERELNEAFPGENAISSLKRTVYGKPWLVTHPSWHFNISHCRTCVALVMDKRPVGIDVEKRFEWKDGLARRVCHDEEWAFLGTIADPSVRRAWLQRIWSRKESYLKCIGSGFHTQVQSFSVLDSRNDRTDRQNITFSGVPEPIEKPSACICTGEGFFRFIEWQTRDYTLCICRQNPDGPAK